MICFVCGIDIGDRQYRKHLEEVHVYKLENGITCPEVSCKENFSILSSFKRHFRSVHEKCKLLPSSDSEMLVPNSIVYPNVSSYSSIEIQQPSDSDEVYRSNCERL